MELLLELVVGGICVVMGFEEGYICTLFLFREKHGNATDHRVVK